ncbi:MAG: VOC family protein [Patescibacteria group bacterium]
MATIPVDNLNRATNFYANVLGLKRGKPFPNGIRMEAGSKKAVALYLRPRTNSDHTVAWFTVVDFDKTTAELLANGVKFDRYNMPGYSDLGNGIYKFGANKVAWFNDSERNILCVSGEW